MQAVRLLLAATALVVACGKDDGPTAPAPEPPVQVAIQDSLVFTGAGSTRIEMGTAHLACCGLYDPSFVNERAMRIVLYDPAAVKAGWQILILIDRAQAGAATTLPTAVVPPSKVPYVSMFATDGAAEWSSDTDESSGTITVHSFGSDARSFHVDFSVDATLGSELAGGAPIGVKGTFKATFPAQSCTP